MIRPTLFIGLGTTGAEILGYLQELVLEEYGVPALPCFKYLAIETRDATRPGDVVGGRNEIEMVYTLVQDTDNIRRKMRSGEASALQDWFHPDILRLSGNQINDGVGNLRMAGRLCLWENWGEVAQKLSQAADDVRDRVAATHLLLLQHYARLGQDVDRDANLVDQVPGVYICGSLCGGTCGGMFVDIAYYLRDTLSLWRPPGREVAPTRVHGLFTILDAGSVVTSQEDIELRMAANCWASLIEHDYYCHPRAGYHAVFPDGREINRTAQPPLDYTYLVSCAGQGGLFRSAQRPDTKALNRMAALVLFTAVVGDLAREAAGIRVDYKALPRAIQLDDAQHSSCFASCGISAYWYPKYRISEAAALRVAAKVCRDWAGETPSGHKAARTDEEATREWEQMRDVGLGILTQGPHQQLRADVEQWFAQNRSELLELDDHAKGLLDALLSKLRQGGEYDEITRKNQATMLRTMQDQAGRAITERINTTKDFADVTHFVARLDSRAGEWLKNLPTGFPPLTPPWQRDAVRAGPDIWSRVLLQGSTVAKEKRTQTLADIEQWFLGKEGALELVARYRAREPVEGLRRFLGVGVQPTAEEQVLTQTMGTGTERVRRKLRSCHDRLQAKADELTGQLPGWENMQVITPAGAGIEDLKEEVDVLVRSLQHLDVAEWTALLQEAMEITLAGRTTQRPFNQYLETENEEGIERSLVAPIQRRALRMIGAFDIPTQVRKMPRAQVLAFARRSHPWLDLAGRLGGVQHRESLVAGCGEGVAPLIAWLAEPNQAPHSIEFNADKTVRTPLLSHLLMFYREEGLLYMDGNLAAANQFNMRYEQWLNPDASRRSRETGTREDINLAAIALHTHKMGRDYFDVWRAIRHHEAAELMKIARDLFSRLGQEPCMFEPAGRRGEEMVFRYIMDNGLEGTILLGEKGVETMASSDTALRQFRKAVEAAFRKIGRDGAAGRVNAYLHEVEQRDGIEVRRVAEEEYKHILDWYFPAQEEEGKHDNRIPTTTEERGPGEDRQSQ